MKNIFRHIAIFSIGLTATASALTLNLSLDKVSTVDLNPTPTSTLAILVVLNGTSSFTDPTQGASLALNSYLTGTTGNGSFIAWRGDFSSFGTAGVFSQNISFNIGTANIPENASFALYWFPTLTTADTTLSANQTFGFYTSTNASQFGSQSAWNTGGNNAAVLNINAYTLNNTGNLTTNPLAGGLADSALSANQIVAVPEPGTMALIGVGGCLLFVGQRLRRRSGCRD